MTYKTEDLKGMIPLYLRGKLSGPEKAEVGKAIQKHPDLKREVEEFSGIQEAYQGIVKEAPSPPDLLYSKILNNINRSEETLYSRAGFWEFLRSLFSSPRAAWAVAGAQVVIIVIMAVFVFQDKGFQTLTVNPDQGEGIMINVVFKGDAREKEIRDLMIKAGTKIIGGPTLDGLYVLEVKDNQVAENSLEILAGSKIVRFSEQAL